MRGFTLVEILVTTLILAFLVAGIYAVLSVGNIVFREDINLVELQQQARRAIDGMINEIRESKSSEITLSEGNTRIAFNIPPEVYGNPWVGPINYYRDINDVNSDTVTDQVIREYPVGTMKILANDITSLDFSVTGDIVAIQLSASRIAGGRQLCFPAPCESPARTLRETVKLRN